MGGTRIVVLQLKQLIRTGIFVLVGIAVIVALVMILLPKNKNADSAAYIPGTYTAQIILHNKPVNVEVTVSDKKIEGISLAEMEETQEVFYPLFKPTLETLAKEIIRKQTTNIAASPNAEFTSKILIEAVNKALLKALADTEIQ